MPIRPFISSETLILNAFANISAIAREALFLGPISISAMLGRVKLFTALSLSYLSYLAQTRDKSVISKVTIEVWGSKWHPEEPSLKVIVFITTLQSGFLLFEMQQGLVQVKLSFWQRVYLLWTFRNFRHLSIFLLNARQRALLTDLFANGESVAPDSPDPSLVIGVVVDFVPPTDRTLAAPAQNKELQAERVLPCAEGPPMLQPVAPSFQRGAWSRIATVAGVLFLFAIVVVTWHRIREIRGSQAHAQRRPRDKVTHQRDSAHSQAPSALAQNSSASVPVGASARQHAMRRSVVQAASITPVIPELRPRIQTAGSAPDIQPSSQDNSIQASRAPVHLVYPAYPDLPIRGVVALTARVDSGGAVLSVRVVSGQRALAAAAVSAVRQWRYSPYLEDGAPVATETNIVISFFSKDAISICFVCELPPTRAEQSKPGDIGMTTHSSGISKTPRTPGLGN